MEIIQIKPGASDFKLFADFPEKIYPKGSIRFKLPEAINQELLDTCFVLLDNGKPQARAALYNNPALYYHAKKSFCVGNYEAINDRAVSMALFTEITAVAKTKGAQFLIGPMNGSTWDNYRFSLHHDNPSFFLEPYHHLYYNEQFTHVGFHVIANYFSGIDTRFVFGKPEVLKRKDELLSDGITFRTLNLSQYSAELEKLFDFSTLAFKTNFLYTPINKQTFVHKYAALKNLIDPELVLLAEDANKNLIGYIFCVADFFNLNTKTFIVKTVARHPDKRWAGLGHVMGDIIYKKSANQNYQAVIHAFVIEQGTSTAMSKNFSGTIYKNYALYGKEIT